MSSSITCECSISWMYFIFCTIVIIKSFSLKDMVSFAFTFMSVICKSRTRWYDDFSEQTTAIFHFFFC